ncbi:hypothetical protein M3Y99_00149900 [Aphelenchoides fujianensis]|nr:hypothetical protein M3Y99_00149900 [Aphelenchoides fujianensis]
MLSSSSICFLLLLCATSVGATFTDGFRRFLVAQFGAAVEANLTRLDFGVRGSFGGGDREVAVRTNHTPVVIVHGLSNVAGDYHEAFALWMSRGYSQEEVYATTYGPRGSPVSMNSLLSCDYVKQIRQLIIAVNAYTQSKIFNTNSRAHYEGDRVLTIESTGDDVVGFQTASGVRMCEVPQADRAIILIENLTHERTVFSTQPLQFDLLVSNAPYPPVEPAAVTGVPPKPPSAPALGGGALVEAIGLAGRAAAIDADGRAAYGGVNSSGAPIVVVPLTAVLRTPAVADGAERKDGGI